MKPGNAMRRLRMGCGEPLARHGLRDLAAPVRPPVTVALHPASPPAPRRTER